MSTRSGPSRGQGELSVQVAPCCRGCVYLEDYSDRYHPRRYFCLRLSIWVLAYAELQSCEFCEPVDPLADRWALLEASHPPQLLMQLWLQKKEGRA
jgi:hypothetical protein